jgi:hypothetical protein
VKFAKLGPSSHRACRMSSTGTMLFISFLAIFWCLPSRDYMAVDGSVRSLELYHHGWLTFDGNNHLLYPFWLRLWSHFVQGAGIHAANAFQFIKISQAMDGVLGAASITIVFNILGLLVEQKVALLCSLMFGFSTAMLLHATNSAEPLPGLLFSLVGFRVLMTGLRRKSLLVLVSAGICFAFALASYQAMATVAGVGVFACVWWSTHRPVDVPTFRAPTSIVWVFIGGLFGVCVIYGLAYSHQGIALTQMPHHFFALGGSPEVYSGFSLSRIVNVPFGLLRNVFNDVPPQYAGIRSLLRGPARTFWIPAVMAGLLTVALIFLMVSKIWWRMPRKHFGAVMMTGFGAFALLCFPLVYWDPMYDKLWLLPLAVGTAVVAVGFRPGLLGSGERIALMTLLIVVLATEIAANLSVVIRRHYTAAPDLAYAEEVSRLVKPQDWIVVDFDKVSTLWYAFWGQNSRVLLLPSATDKSARDWLVAAKRACQESGARILFIGVLDQDKKSWDAFLGQKVRIPFGLLDEYRGHATVLKEYDLPGGPITVREYR